MTSTIKKYASTTSEYKELKKRLKIVELEKAELEETILAHYKENKHYETEFGTVVIDPKRTWGGWPDDVVKLDEELKALKLSTKQVGNSNYEITRTVKIK